MDDSLLSDGSFFAEEIEQEQHIPSITAAEDTDLTSDMEDMSSATQTPRGTGLDILVRQSQKQTGNPGRMTGKQRPLSAKAGSSYASKKNAPLLQTLFPKGSLSVKSTETSKKGRGGS
jgi:predicted transcriptional regulator